MLGDCFHFELIRCFSHIFYTIISKAQVHDNKLRRTVFVIRLNLLPDFFTQGITEGCWLKMYLIRAWLLAVSFDKMNSLPLYEL